MPETGIRRLTKRLADLPPPQLLALADALEGQVEARVSMRQFLEDPAYLGGETFWPSVKQDLIDLYDGPVRYREADFIEGIGAGKSVKVSVIFAYELYDLERLVNPQESYSLKSGSIIALLNMAPTAGQAKAVVFNEVKQRIESCAWFRAHGVVADPRVASELHFPKHIRIFPGNSSMTFPLGYNIKAAIIDEAAFYDDTETADTAEEIHTALSRRMTSRFGMQGGPLVNITSPRYVDDFVETRAQSEDPMEFRRRRPTWEAKPYAPEVPRFEITHPSSGTRVQIPIDFERDFTKNPEKAWRDFGAVPSLVLEPYFKDREAVARGLVGENRDITTPWTPKAAIYAIHVDLGKTHDAAGIAVGYLQGEAVTIEAAWQIVSTTQRQTERFPHALTAGATEIDFETIRAWIVALRDAGFPLVSVSYDGWQSVDSLQLLTKAGIPVQLLSVDRDLAAYDTMKELLYEGRLALPVYAPLKQEISRLELKDGKKVDHPPKGCFTGDTRVALLDGTLPTFEELGRRFPHGERFPVFSMGASGVCFGWAHHPRVSRTQAELVEILLDNFQVVRCTPDHLFLTLDGRWVEASQLNPTTSIMPLYRAREGKGGLSGYERVWCPIRRQRVLMHHLVAQQAHGPIGPHMIVHHRDHVKHNNHPDNLLIQDRREHGAHHTRLRHQQDLEWVARLRSGHARYRATGGDERSRQNMLALHRNGVMKAARTSKQVNHRILSVRPVTEREDVWDITVDGTHNFALASGVFVHNSKDVADAVAGVCWALMNSELVTKMAASEMVGQAEVMDEEPVSMGTPIGEDW